MRIIASNITTKIKVKNENAVEVFIPSVVRPVRYSNLPLLITLIIENKIADTIKTCKTFLLISLTLFDYSKL